MTKVEHARDGADAVHRFSRAIDRAAGAPARILARFDGDDGMARLCLVEAALSDLWPSSTAKELVWLTRSGPREDDAKLQLTAYSAEGAPLCEATFWLASQHV